MAHSFPFTELYMNTRRTQNRQLEYCEEQSAEIEKNCIGLELLTSNNNNNNNK